MAKDPAVLFYTQDFLTGTMLMTDKQRGQYIVLLCLQHQNGKLTEKEMLKVCRKPDPEIWSKFYQENGYFINKRMLLESEKRNKHLEHQSENAKKRWMPRDMPNASHGNATAYAMGMPLENEILEYKEELKNKELNPKNKEQSTDGQKEKSKKFTPPTEDEVIAYFIEKGYKTEIAKRAFLYYSEQNWHDSTGKAIKSWKGKMVAVWFKEENKAQDTRGQIDLTQMRNERKSHL